MPKTAPQFFRFKSKEIASRRRDRSGPARVQLTTNQTGQPFTFKTTPQTRVKRPTKKPEIHGPYKQRKQSKGQPVLTLVEKTPNTGGIKKEPKPKKIWVSKETTGKLTDLAVTSVKIFLAGLCSSALISTIRN